MSGQWGTAIHDYSVQMASFYGHHEIVKLLVNSGANIHAVNDLALQQASYAGHTEVVKLLLDNGANVHAKDDCALQTAYWNSRHMLLDFVPMVK